MFVLSIVPFCSCKQDKSMAVDLQLMILEFLEVDSVAADFPVGFSSLSRNDWQFIAYYNKNRNITVAPRKVSESKWNSKFYQ